MKKIWMLSLVLLPFVAAAQGGDKSKVMKEIEIAENILASLLQQEIEVADDIVIINSNGSSGNVEGTYIEDFGALFTIGGESSFRGISIGGNSKIATAYNYRYNLKGIAKLQERLPYTIYLDSDGKRIRKQDRDRDGNDQNVEAEASSEVVEGYDDFEFFKKVSRDFFVDYGYLMKGIKSNEKVLIRYVRNNNVAVVIDGWNQGDGWSSLRDKDWDDERGVYTAMVLKSDIEALQRGNLSETQFENKIAYTEGEEVETESKDMKLINSIFSRLYKDDLSGSECISSRSTPRSEYIPDLGLVVNMRMNTRCRGSRGFGSRLELFREGQGFFTLLDPEEDEDEEENEDRENAAKSYPEFLSTLKENVVEYGSIAKSLEEGEVLVFNVAFSGCRDCKLIPEQLSITAKQATLAAYRQGKLSLEKAVEQLNIVE